ncbi:hypothetical protein BV22DRAFT_9949 [Leucogyrophana mollusca]|uniref:Uncharacterized protein n=1 Tax=Leucogyrophana mollusca TaxID=85980 RepID=A0ACB8C0G7_9AGAM|nr:hypothetical protein BV22DRAFT_9949 [Leucogyrophana mollusca]
MPVPEPIGTQGMERKIQSGSLMHRFGSFRIGGGRAKRPVETVTPAMRCLRAHSGRRPVYMSPA